MRNAIQYYYKIFPTNIHQINNIYKFKINEIKYILYPCDRSDYEIKEIYDLQIYLAYIGIYCHKIILNVNNEISTRINNLKYVLLEVNIDNRKINIKDIEYLSNIVVNPQKYSNIKRKNWSELWIKKIDYLEYQINQFGKKNKKIRESADYYIGIVENCIALINNNLERKTRIGITHDRINMNYTTEEFYNPINFIIDNRIRDISEYFKSYIYKEIDITQELNNYITSNNLNHDEIELLFIRILYPSIYIDKCDAILNKIENEDQLSEIIKKVVIIEKNIKKIYHQLMQNYKLPDIEWLKKT